MEDIRKHHRINRSILAVAEKRLLIWMAERLPGWMNPDVLTGIGVLGALVIFFGYWLCMLNKNFLWLASFGFIINWFGDSLDGTLARVRHIERPKYGFYIDHSVDAFNEILVFLGLGLSPFVRFDLACLALIGYLLISILVYIETCVKGEFCISYVGLGPTEARLIAMTANTLIYFTNNPTITLYSFRATLYDWIAIFIIFLLAYICISTVIRNAKALYHVDQQESN